MQSGLINTIILILIGCLSVSCSSPPSPLSPSISQPANLVVRSATPFENHLNTLIKELGNEDWNKREAATKEIQKIIDYYINEIGEDPEHPSREMDYLLNALAYTSEKGQPPDMPNTQPDLEIQLRALQLYAPLKLRLNPVAWWRFDDQPGPVIKDSSGNGNDATVHDATWKDGAFYFDGIDDYITTPLVTTLQDFTIEVWVKPEPNNCYVMDVVSKRSCNALTQSDFPFALTVSNAATSAGISIESGNDFSWDMSASTPDFDNRVWHHIAATYDSTTLKIYLDGKLAGSTSGFTELSNNDRPYTIGRASCEAEAQRNQTGYKGFIGEVRIYNCARNPAQILRDYNDMARPTTKRL